MKKVITCIFKDGREEEATIFIKVLNKMKNDPGAVTQLDESMFEAAVNKGMEEMREIN
jgi:hypothetical protein